MCPPRAETQAARHLRHCFMALSISCWSILSHSSEMCCLSSVNTGNLASINPVLHDPPDLVINRIQLNVHFFSGKSLIIRCGRVLFFCKIKINVDLLQKKSLLWFLQKRHNCVTAQRITNQFCPNQTTFGWHIHLCIMHIRWMFHKNCPKTVRNIWKKEMYYFFSEHGVYL